MREGEVIVMFNRKAMLLFIILAMSILSTGCNSEPPESVESVRQKVVAYLLSKGYKEADFNIDVKYNKMGGPYSIKQTGHDSSKQGSRFPRAGSCSFFHE